MLEAAGLRGRQPQLDPFSPKPPALLQSSGRPMAPTPEQTNQWLSGMDGGVGPGCGGAGVSVNAGAGVPLSDRGRPQTPIPGRPSAPGPGSGSSRRPRAD